jgi:hypothetical protein
MIFRGVMDVLNGIAAEEFERIFDEWRLRLQACVQRDGDDVE